MADDIKQGLVFSDPILPAPPSSAPSDAVVEQWFADAFHGLPIPTDLFNRFYAAKLDLMARLRAAAKE